MHFCIKLLALYFISPRLQLLLHKMEEFFVHPLRSLYKNMLEIMIYSE